MIVVFIPCIVMVWFLLTLTLLNATEMNCLQHPVLFKCWQKIIKNPFTLNCGMFTFHIGKY